MFKEEWHSDCMSLVVSRDYDTDFVVCLRSTLLLGLGLRGLLLSNWGANVEENWTLTTHSADYAYFPPLSPARVI